MAKKSKWWFRDSDEDDSVLFPNTVKEHNKQISAPVYQGGELLNMEDYVGEDYYGWNKKPTQKDEVEVDEFDADDTAENYDVRYRERQKKALVTQESKKFGDELGKKWDNWEGYSYYRTPTLTYRYVQQMANALASQHKITVKVGNDWVCDLTTKTLTYNPATLIYSTKSELLATLLHEIGKLRYSNSFDELRYNSNGNPISHYLNKYGMLAYTAMMPFEELRIDTKMLGEYGSAGEIYESQEPSLQEVYMGYKKLSKQYKKWAIDVAHNVFMQKLNNIKNNDIGLEIQTLSRLYMIKGDSQEEAIHHAIKELGVGKTTISDKIKAVFGVDTVEEAVVLFDKMANAIKKKDTIYDYIASVYSEAYLLKREKDYSAGMIERLKKTNPSFKPITRFKTTKEVVGEMDANVYPVIEDLLEENKNGFDEMEQFSGADFKKEVNGEIQRGMAQMAKDGRGQLDKNGNQKVRLNNNSGPTNETTVPEWFKGDYKVLKDSVRGEITRLTRMLTFLKRTEQTVKWVANQRRGRLNMKKLYRARLGNRRVFKSRIESTDTIRSFAFSIVIDVSGSMSGSRIANTTRGMIILAEVFKDMGIPFEIITFDDGAKVLKSFDGAFDKKVENSIGGLPNYGGGGTNLDRGLKAMKLKDRTERNKICIVLTDGGVGSPEDYNAQYFRPMLQSDHIKSLAFGLEINKKEIERLCNGTGRAIENAVEVPYVFADLLKSLMIKK